MMKRSLTWRRVIETKQYSSNEWSIHLHVTSEILNELCCELALLLFGKAESLSLIPTTGPKAILKVAADNSQVLGSKEKSIAIALNQDQLVEMLAYLLVWYRDGAADVRHIDVDLIADSTLGSNCTLVVHAESSKEPLSADEAMRLLRAME